MAFDPRSPGGNPGQRIYADGLADDLRYGKYFYMGREAAHPLILQHGTQTAPVTVPTFPTAVQDNIDTIYVPNPFGGVIELYQTTAQTLMPSRHASKGLSIGCDLVDNESVEYVFGGNHAANPYGCLVGTDPGILIEVTFELADASGMDQFGILLRKQEAYVVPTSFLSTGDAGYTDFCLFGFAGTAAAANPVRMSTDLNNSGSATVTDAGFTWADGKIHKLAMRLQGRNVRFFINDVELGGRVSKDAVGAALTAQQTVSRSAFQFDSGDFIIPGIFVRHDAAAPGAVYIREATVAQLKSVGLHNEDRPY